MGVRVSQLAAALGCLVVMTAPGRAADEGVALASNAFAIDLYHTLEAENGNFFFSPNSIDVALAMTCAGARGTTAEAMAKVLHFPAKDGAAVKELGAFAGELNAEKTSEGKPRGYQLSLANSIWVQKGYPVLKDYLDLLKTGYGALPQQADFEHDSEGARQAINGWVEKKTRDKIKELIHAGDLKPLTRLVLANAIYFKGKWEMPFAKAETRQEPFHDAAGHEEKPPMMHRTGDCGYLENNELQALKLPYSGRELSLVILLPRKTDGLPALEKSLTAGKLDGWMNGMGSRKVVVTLPKFTATTRIYLGENLKKLGMGAAFDPVKADFTGITDRRGLYISKVIHKAFVAVDEEGTEAAAATGVVLSYKSVMPMEEPPVVFRADHPFVYVIRHEASGVILFMGRLASTGTDGQAQTQ